MTVCILAPNEVDLRRVVVNQVIHLDQTPDQDQGPSQGLLRHMHLQVHQDALDQLQFQLGMALQVSYREGELPGNLQLDLHILHMFIYFAFFFHFSSKKR